ncbi:MAG: alpha/beta hydrolase, partial [Rhodomicrobium sp.]
SLSGIVDELRGALDWFAGHRREHGFEGPLILSGWSAGGHLAAMLLDHPSVSAALAISGIYELGPLRDTYINEKLKLTDQEIASLSPMRLALTGKPMAIAYGTAELPALVENSRRFHRKRAGADAPGSLIPVPGADHFTILEELRRPNGVLAKAAIRLCEDLE